MNSPETTDLQNLSIGDSRENMQIVSIGKFNFCWNRLIISEHLKNECQSELFLIEFIKTPIETEKKLETK